MSIEPSLRYVIVTGSPSAMCCRMCPGVITCVAPALKVGLRALRKSHTSPWSLRTLKVSTYANEGASTSRSTPRTDAVGGVGVAQPTVVATTSKKLVARNERAIQERSTTRSSPPSVSQ